MNAPAEQDGFRVQLRQVMESQDSTAGRLFDSCVQSLIIASMIAFAIETIPELSESTRTWLRRFEYLTLTLFLIEYLARLYVAEKPLAYARSFFGIVDLLALLPVLLSTTIDARTIRSLRLLRLLRLLKLARYNAAIQRLHLAMKIAWEELVLFGFVSAILLFIAAAGVYQFEHKAQPEAFASIFHALWWAVATLTTVGYGDVYPVTAGGRIFTFAVLLVGLGIIAAPTAMIASALTEARKIEENADDKIL